jgi:hypothetical protein
MGESTKGILLYLGKPWLFVLSLLRTFLSGGAWNLCSVLTKSRYMREDVRFNRGMALGYKVFIFWYAVGYNHLVARSAKNMEVWKLSASPLLIRLFLFLVVALIWYQPILQCFNLSCISRFGLPLLRSRALRSSPLIVRNLSGSTRKKCPT